MKYYQIFIILYLSVGFVPYFGAADKVVPQILYLNIINICSIIYLINKKINLNQISKYINNIPFLLYLSFFIWSSITLVNAINLIESIQTLSEVFTILTTFYFLIFFLSKLKNIRSFVFYVIIVFTIIESLQVLVPFFTEIYIEGSPTQRGMVYRGYTGNINILAYILLIKFPFLIYYLISNQGNKKLMFALIVVVSFIISGILATRSAILSLFLVTAFICFSYTYITYRESNSNIRVILTILLKRIIFPIILGFILTNLLSLRYDSQSLQERMGTLANINEDSSASQRLGFYQDAIESFFEKPIMGKGIGSWELESIKYVMSDLSDYVVPYHAHNDYLELLAETGIPGFLFYFGVIFFTAFLLLKKILNKTLKTDDRLFSLFLLSSIIIYLLDSMFNFPFDRTLQQVFIFFFVSTSLIFLKVKETRFRYSTHLVFLIIILIPFSLYSSARMMKASRGHTVLLKAFNNDDYLSPSIEEIDKFEMDYTNLTPTTLPSSTVKGLFYMKNGKYRDAVQLFKKGIEDNPYLYISESFLGYVYLQLNMTDSAYKYSKVAFEKMPKNRIHYANYMFTLVELKDSLALKETFSSLDISDRDPIYDEVYLMGMAAITNPENTEFALDGLDLNVQSGNDRLKKGYYVLKVGEDKMFEADRYYQTAVYYFERENFLDALDFFKRADNINPYELVYKENIANTYLRMGEDSNALNVLNELINEFDSTSPKAYYLRGLILISLDDQKEQACLDLKYANDRGLISNTSIYELACLSK